MAKFKVGDKVIVRTDLDGDEKYWMDDKSDYWYTDDEIEELVGKTVTIKECHGGYYLTEETSRNCYWTDEMFVGLKEKTPMPKEFKVGDRVRAIQANWGELKVGDLGTVIVYKGVDDIGVEFDNPNGGHDCGCGKNGHCWWVMNEDIELVKEEPKKEPTPTSININLTVNLYENACWYCRKGGLVDLYLAGAMGICPSCGRVCNNTVPTPKKDSIVIEFKPKENKPLTKKELEALPNGTKVFIVWCWDMQKDCKGTPKWETSGWGVKKKERCYWKCDAGREHQQANYDYDRCFDAYLEEPKRPS